MMTPITVPIYQDEIFRRCCAEIDLTYTCIQEGEKDNRYEVIHETSQMIYYLGIRVAVESILTEHPDE